MAQKKYGFQTPIGVPGGIYDINDYSSNSRCNEEEDGVLQFGTGVVVGTNPGTDVKRPAADSTEVQFEGVVMNTGTTEMDKLGKVAVPTKATVGVMPRGRIWVRIGADANPEYGKPVYLIKDGDEAGYFTTDDDDSSKIAIPARFIKPATTEGLAAIELYGGVSAASAAAANE